MSQPVIEIQDITFGYDNQKPILQIDSLCIKRSGRVFISGPSGCGKSSLLGLISGVLTPKKGRVSILNNPLHEWGASQRDQFRANHCGVIFQLFNLIPYLSVIDNVGLPLQFSQDRKRRIEQTGKSIFDESSRLLSALGINSDLHKQCVTDLSVGQQQRVAAARALIGAPEIIIADEPTSALDAAVCQQFIELLIQECDTSQSTLIFVSHDDRLSQYFDDRVDLNRLNTVREGQE